MKYTKFIYTVTTFNKLILYISSAVLTLIWAGMLYNINLPDSKGLFCMTGFLFAATTCLSVLYSKIPKLVAFTLYILSINLYSLGITLITNQVCGAEFYVFSSIPAIFLFTHDLKKPKYYFHILTFLIFVNLIFISYKRMVQPLEILWLKKQSQFFISSVYYSTIITTCIVFLGCMLCDITLRRMNKKEKHMKEAMDFAAKHDPLTGLMNRRRIEIVFKDCEERKKLAGTDYAIAMFDIDDFKKINDIYGHSAGDFVLKTYSKRVWDIFPVPVRIGRWGGEEFVIIFPAYDKEIIFRVEDMRARVCSKPVIFEGQEIKVTATYGISSSKKFNSAQEILNDADEALYAGKQNGKNRLVVSENF